MPYKDPEKRREAARRCYQKHRTKNLQRIKTYSRGVRDGVYAYKAATPCTDCGCFYPYYVMEFDHVRGVKLANIADMINRNTTYKKVWTEIKKCELVCANCHRLRTYSRLERKKKVAG